MPYNYSIKYLALKAGETQLRELISIISGYGSVYEPMLSRKLACMGSPELVCGLCRRCDPVSLGNLAEQSAQLPGPGDLNFFRCSCCLIHAVQLVVKTRRAELAVSDSLNALLYICGRVHADFRRIEHEPVDSSNPNL